jgi:hypothetical protein
MSKLSSFVEPALRASNGDGAALAVLRLRECYEKCGENDVNDIAEDAVDRLVHVGAVGAALEDKASSSELLHEGISESVSQILTTSPFTNAITRAVREVFIKSYEYDHNKVWEFILKLGAGMETNFGFMFDWTTGKTYSDDDPRRLHTTH